jgi:hypothetical protein
MEIWMSLVAFYQLSFVLSVFEQHHVTTKELKLPTLGTCTPLTGLASLRN